MTLPSPVTTPERSLQPLILAIEATNPNVPTPGVLVARGGVVLASTPLVQQGRHDDVLLPAIAGLLRQAGCEPHEIDEVLVSTGPGGFTATRLSVVAAAVLAETSGARVLAVPTARVAIETTLQEQVITQPVVVAMATKGDLAYVARFDPAGGAASDTGRSIGPDAFASVLLPGDTLVFEGHLPEKMREIAKRGGVPCIPMRLSAEGLLACRSEAQTVPAEALRPIYPREPDAVTQWRRRYGTAPGDD